MAINWSAYEACKELYGNNIENIQDIGSRFPLFARACMQVNDEALLDKLAEQFEKRFEELFDDED